MSWTDEHKGQGAGQGHTDRPGDRQWHWDRRMDRGLPTVTAEWGSRTDRVMRNTERGGSDIDRRVGVQAESRGRKGQKDMGAV